MNIDTIQMDARVARIHYLDYKKKVLEHREERAKLNAKDITEAGRELRRVRAEKSRLEREDEELMKAYKAMSLGQRILNLNSVMMKSGVFPETHLPKLCIARADWKDCFFDADEYKNGGRVAQFRDARWAPNKKERRVDLPQASFPAETTNSAWRAERRKAGYTKLLQYPVKAIVPSIPAHLRPAGDLGDYHILWEAEWFPTPPVDPLLLKQVGEYTYTVLAQWDLTPLERSILEGRL